MPRVLITGAAGFIGMHTSIRFLEEGWDVIGLDNLNDYYSVKLKRDRLNQVSTTATKSKGTFEFFEADLNSSVWEDLESVNFNAVIHLAAQAGVRYSIENPRAYLESNILGFQSVLEFVSCNSIYRFVYASSSSVYGKSSKQPFAENASCNDPESYYAATKKSNELMANAYYKTRGVSSVGLRFFTVYGPWGRPDMAPMLFAKAAIDGEGIKVFNHGNQQRDFTFIDDIVEGLYRIIVAREFPKKPKIFNIGGGKPISLMDFIRLIEKESEKLLDKEFLPEQKGDVKSTIADTTKLKNFISFTPQIDIEEGIKRFWRWYSEYHFK